MKKTHYLTAPNKAPERQADWVKHEIKKYLGREKRKALPEGVDYWDFDCKIGLTEADAVKVFVNEINAKISGFAAGGAEAFYLEILAKPGKHNPNKRPRSAGREQQQEDKD